jgi:hypothetical protein
VSRTAMARPDALALARLPGKNARVYLARRWHSRRS